MKKSVFGLMILSLTILFSGCEYIVTPVNHYVSVYNNDYGKYITSVCYRPAGYYDEYWSKNLVYDFIYPNEASDFLIEEGEYDFRAVMEDDYYSYEIEIDYVYIYQDIELDVCMECLDKKDNVKIIKTPKKISTNNKE